MDVIVGVSRNRYYRVRKTTVQPTFFVVVRTITSFNFNSHGNYDGIEVNLQGCAIAFKWIWESLWKLHWPSLIIFVCPFGTRIDMNTCKMQASNENIKNNSQYFKFYLTDSQGSNLQFNRNCTRLCMPIRPFGAHTIDFPFERWMKSFKYASVLLFIAMPQQQYEFRISNAEIANVFSNNGSGVHTCSCVGKDLCMYYTTTTISQPLFFYGRHNDATNG